MGLEAPRERKICENLQVMSLYSGSLDSSRLATKLLSLEALGLDKAKTQKISKRLVNTDVICTSTKAGAEMLAAAAETDEQRHQATRCMAKVATGFVLPVLREKEVAEKLYKDMLEVVPALAVRKAAGKSWFHTKPPAAKDWLVMQEWLVDLTMPEVHERLNFLFAQKKEPWQPLIKPLQESIVAFCAATSKRQNNRHFDVEETLLAPQDSMTDDDIHPTSSKKSRAPRRCFTVSEEIELQDLLALGKLNRKLSREHAARRISERGCNLSLKQLESWIGHRRYGKKKV
jgi:hypothetical protein